MFVTYALQRKFLLSMLKKKNPLSRFILLFPRHCNSFTLQSFFFVKFEGEFLNSIAGRNIVSDFLVCNYRIQGTFYSVGHSSSKSHLFASHFLINQNMSYLLTPIKVSHSGHGRKESESFLHFYSKIKLLSLKHQEYIRSKLYEI